MPADTQPHSILIIDDHPLFRKGVAQLIELEPTLQVIGEASNGADGIEAATRLNPDLILLDLQMKGLDGLATLAALKDQGCEARVLILTVSDQPEDLIAAIRAGADGYLLKDMDPEELLAAIRDALFGRMVLAPRLNGLLAQALRTEAQTANRSLSALTDREAQILKCLAGGLSNKMIARELDITEGTVKVHLKHLLKKLNFRSRVEAAVWAVENGVKS